MGKTPLKADSPKFTPACINTSKPMGSKTLSAKARSFTPGAKAAEIKQFFVLGLQPAGYGEHGCESWQQGNGGDYNNVHGGHSGYGSSIDGPHGSEIDPTDPMIHPPPFELGAGRHSVRASEFRLRRQAFKGGKGHEGSTKAAGRGAGPTLRTRPPVYNSIRVKLPQPVRDPWVVPDDDGPWGDADTWHATSCVDQHWRPGGGWPRDGGLKDQWKQDCWASNWNGNMWRDRHCCKHGWDDRGKRRSLLLPRVVGM